MERTASTQKRFGNAKIVSGHDDEGNRIPSQIGEEESLGVPRDDVWDIARVPPVKQLFPTQKPDALISRIIRASTNKGDIVADFFGGCGTTVMEAQALKRQWIGVDISHLSISLIRKRLIALYREPVLKTFDIDGFPKDIATAKMLASDTAGGRFKFQDWIIETMLDGVHNPKKVADGGWDGYLTFLDENGKKQIALIEVKSGNVGVSRLRDFIQAVDSQKAVMGVFVCFEGDVTKPMATLAKQQGYCKIGGNDAFLKIPPCDKIQIVTVEGLLEGKGIKIPARITTFKEADKKEVGEQSELL